MWYNRRMTQTLEVVKKVRRFEQGLSIYCKHHGEHSQWKCYANNVQCVLCIRERSKRYSDTHYLKQLALWTRRRDHQSEVTEDFLKDLLVVQGNRCALTGTPFDEANRPSIDRKDSTVGYTKQNVHLVLFDINRMKTDLSLDRFIDLCARVTIRSKDGKHGEVNCLS